MRHAHTHKGFTLLEVLLVVAIIGILAGIVIIAINPNKQLADTRNTQRKADVNTIISAVYQYTIDNNGVIPSAITSTSTEICATGAGSCSGLINLSALTSSGKYVVAMPSDPSGAIATNGIGYKIRKDGNNRIIVDATQAEEGLTISVTR
jgi:type IV pilus assembly protein PilA